ncbi:MAG: major facilitator superfamily 1 [Clostridia bacterium]|jgi:MFS family permease|nr:major facilitator superfamily 1 [Clostridia bacterium]
MMSFQYYVKQNLLKPVHMFKSLKGNARGAAIYEPLWAIPFQMFNFYASLYMLALGLSEKQVGLVSSIYIISQIIWSFLGGAITDKLGRKRTTLIFDLIAWPFVALIWTFASNFWLFAIAALLNGLGKVVFISWSCLLVEDSPPEQRVNIFTVINIIVLCSGVFSPVAGLIVNRFGIINGTRILYIFAAVSMTIMILGRNSLLTETSIGRIMQKESKGFSFQQLIYDFMYTVRFVKGHSSTLIILVIQSLVNFHLLLKPVFYSVYLTNNLLLDKSFISIVPALSSISMLVIFLFVIPMVKGNREAFYLCIGLLVWTAGAIALVLAPAANMAIILSSVIIDGMGLALTRPFLDTLWANVAGEKERAKVLSFGNTFMSLISAPAGVVAALLYDFKPSAPFIFSVILLGICLLLAVFFLKKTIGRQLH